MAAQSTMAPEQSLAEAVTLLGHARSPKRRSGAKRLRHLRDPRACEALLQALEQEVRDPRTWETQYQMVMALAECDCRAALPFLRQFASCKLEATTVYIALGDALVRLGRHHEQDASPILDAMASGNDMLTDGAFRAVAMLRLTLTPDAVEQIIEFLDARNVEVSLRFWPAAAAAGWRGEHVEAFLRPCLRSARPDLRRAAKASLDRQYLKWHPL